MNRTIFLTGIVFGVLAIILGAFGAHGLEKLIDTDAISTFETGVKYQIYLMNNSKKAPETVSLKSYGITHDNINYQLSPDKLQEITIEKNMGKVASSGALAVNTGEFTGRSPKDRFIVKDDITEEKVWWGDINIPFEPAKFDALMDIRVINEFPWSNMFAYNMFIRPTGEELKNFEPEWTVINAPGFMANKKPEIFGAIRKGALLENVILDADGNVDFEDTSITQNTRVSYPIYNIDNVQRPSIGKNPKNIFFLTADAFGVLPPISKLTPSQAAYHFMSGYTAKVAGTEAGVKEPIPSFSACFGAPFMPLHPAKYAEMLSRKMLDAGVNVWLVNTGWTGGPYGVGTRMKLKYTRAMINAVLNGDLGLYNYDDYHIHSVFGVAQPRSCPGVPTDVLSPRTTWNDDQAYYTTAFKLSNAFRENFKQFEAYAK
ncbi:Phosphoenolpyruvate carboxykinase (ATP) [Nymphon striatum]|nr:Phosphoenolpyruvate carboxykinase (ATP) [Nymphon striatum]